MTEIELYNLCHERYSYCPDTGEVRYKIWFKGLKKDQVGSLVGSRSTKGYLDVKILGISYRLHRIIWLMQTGKMPEGVIDHDNRVKDDNRWVNLLDTTQRRNVRNKEGNNFNVVTSSGRHNVMISIQNKPTYVCGFQGEDTSLSKAQDVGKYLQSIPESSISEVVSLIKRGRS